MGFMEKRSIRPPAPPEVSQGLYFHREGSEIYVISSGIEYGLSALQVSQILKSNADALGGAFVLDSVG